MFSPVPENPYMQIPQDDSDESIAMEEIVAENEEGLHNTAAGIHKARYVSVSGLVYDSRVWTVHDGADQSYFI